MTETQNRLPREVVVSPSLGMFKNFLDRILDNVLTLLEQGGQTGWPAVIPTWPILWFCEVLWDTSLLTPLILVWNLFFMSQFDILLNMLLCSSLPPLAISSEGSLLCKVHAIISSTLLFYQFHQVPLVLLQLVPLVISESIHEGFQRLERCNTVMKQLENRKKIFVRHNYMETKLF